MAKRKARKPTARRKATKPAALIALPAKHQPGWLDALDRRQRFARALIARRDKLIEDLGGFDALTYQQKTMAERAIFLESVLHQMEARHARGTPLDLNAYAHACNTMTGILKALGLQRAPRPAAQLANYIEGRVIESDK